MTFAGIFLTSITIILVLCIVLLHPFVKKVTGRYIFWLIYSLCNTALVFTFRFIPDILNYADAVKSGLSSGDGIWISKAFLLDFCPFTAVMISVLPIFDYKRKVSQIIAPFAFFGGLITILFEILLDPNASMTFEYIFKGIFPNRAYFLIHFINTITGILLLMNSKKANWKTFMFCNIFAICYYLYIFIVVKISNGLVTDHTSGLLPDDWKGGEYWRVSDILHLDYPWCMIVALSISYGFITLFLFTPRLLQKCQYWKED